MNTTEKFENGLSIVQLEERFEMIATTGRCRGGCLHLGDCNGESLSIE